LKEKIAHIHHALMVAKVMDFVKMEFAIVNLNGMVLIVLNYNALMIVMEMANA